MKIPTIALLLFTVSFSQAQDKFFNPKFDFNTPFQNYAVTNSQVTQKTGLDARYSLRPQCKNESFQTPQALFAWTNDVSSLYRELEIYARDRSSSAEIEQWVSKEKDYFLSSVACDVPELQNSVKQYFQFLNVQFKFQNGLFEIEKADPILSETSKQSWRGIPFLPKDLKSDDVIFESSNYILKKFSNNSSIQLIETSRTSKSEQKLNISQLFTNTKVKNPFVFYRLNERLFLHQVGQPFSEDRVLFLENAEMFKKTNYNQESQYSFSGRADENGLWSFFITGSSQKDLAHNPMSNILKNICVVSNGKNNSTCFPNVEDISFTSDSVLVTIYTPANFNTLVEPSTSLYIGYTNKPEIKWTPLRKLVDSQERYAKWMVQGSSLISFHLGQKDNLLVTEYDISMGTKKVEIELSDILGAEISKVIKVDERGHYLVTTNVETFSIFVDLNKRVVTKIPLSNFLYAPTIARKFSLPIPQVGSQNFIAKYRGDLDLTSGKNKVLIKGYGGFGIESSLSFSSWDNYLIEQGYIVVAAELRGDNKGAFRETGRFNKKWNTITDIESVAQHLIKLGWTSPKKIAFFGGSNGGTVSLLAAKKLNNLLGAAISYFPVTDFANIENLDGKDIGGFWEKEEYGYWPKNNQISPLHVMSAQHAPILLVAGRSDQIVNWAHSLKMMNRLREMGDSSQSYMLALEEGYGHKTSNGDQHKLIEYYVYQFLEHRLNP